MDVKKDYLLTYDEIDLRRAKKDDNLEELAKLIYQTDPYIYPFWFKGEVEEAKSVLPKYIVQPGFIYNYENMYIAHDKTNGHIIGLICAIDHTLDLNYDYTELASISPEYAFVVEKYIKVIIEEVKKNKSMYIVNCCVDKDFRSKRIGTVMLGNFVKLMEKAGYNTIEFDCLLHNVRAKNLYHSLGFKEMYTGIGFNGTENPTEPEIVFFRRKTGDSLLGEFTFDDSLLGPKNNDSN